MESSNVAVSYNGMFTLGHGLRFLVLSIFNSKQDVLQMNNANIEEALDREIVFVNFYADWCRFSQQLKPTFLQASDRFKDNPKILFAAVDCDKEGWTNIAQKYNVNKYPTIKLFRYGELVKKEYRSQRSVEAIEAFIRKQLESPVILFNSDEELDSKIESSKRNIIGYILNDQIQPFHSNFYKSASTLREDCGFWLGSGNWILERDGQMKQNATIYFREPNKGKESNFQYTGALDNYVYLRNWLTDKCIPLVREITFENAEELTEEGLPFLILFRQNNDIESEKLFNSIVTNELIDQKNLVNFLVADGKRFAHPLHHLGKSEKDLPLIAIDSFRHIVQGKLRQFILDLHSGKLHREFHQGPDTTPELPNSNKGTQPPSSVFKQLKPSENRYSMKDKTEL
ncbi:Thioredoxin domain-containing protein [Meloidogyne graminicola]|uniref:Thioredoxin domain-containing protein n=1 Tax=Meloidogyne graminicola TaxID=189291 RepID=A0A8S9ZZH7_9BILA|nr:Thioredoxin domain-containing protein [Meloidogyne graminicola]